MGTTVVTHNVKSSNTYRNRDTQRSNDRSYSVFTAQAEKRKAHRARSWCSSQPTHYLTRRTPLSIATCFGSRWCWPRSSRPPHKDHRHVNTPAQSTARIHVVGGTRHSAKVAACHSITALQHQRSHSPTMHAPERRDVRAESGG